MQLTLSRHVVAGAAFALMSFSTIGMAQDEAAVMNNVDLTYPAPGQVAPIIDKTSGTINQGSLTETMPSRSSGHLIIDGQFRQRYAKPKVDSVDLQSEGTDTGTVAPAAISAPAEADDAVIPPASEGEPMGSLQSPSENQGVATGDTSITSALLWKISGNNIADSYLFGTIHSDDPRVLDQPRELKHAFAMADVFVPEADISSDAIAGLRANMLFDNGNTLESIVGAELFSSVAAKLSTLGVPRVRASRIKPWAAIMMLASPNNKTGEFLDKRLYDEAVAAGKDISPLETIAEQLDVFRTMETDDQITLLKNTLDAHDELPQMIESLTQAWLARDLNELQRISLAGREDSQTQDLASAFHERLIDNRNDTMVQRLLPMLGARAHFVAVGALHLPGEKGLIRQLTDRGFNLTAIY